MNFLLRKAATVSTPVMEVSEEGGVWTIKTSTSLKSMELKFKVYQLVVNLSFNVSRRFTSSVFISAN